MENKKLIAKKRELEGSSNSRRIRHAGSLPGVIYGAEKEPMSVEVNAHDLELILNNSASESIIIDLELDGEGTIPALVKDVQHHPVTSALLHVDLLRVVAGQAIHVEIPLELVGESEGVKKGGLLDQVIHSLAVECLPKNLVESIEVDISEMEIGDTLCVSDLNLGDTFNALVDDAAIVASLSAPKVEEEESEEVSGEPEVITEKKVEA